MKTWAAVAVLLGTANATAMADGSHSLQAPALGVRKLLLCPRNDLDCNPGGGLPRPTPPTPPAPPTQPAPPHPAGVACTNFFNPVCGVDGRTYGNSCKAALAGVAVAHQGACPACTLCHDNVLQGVNESC